MKTKISILGLVFIFLVFASGWAKKIYAKAAEAPLMQLWESYSPSLSNLNDLSVDNDLQTMEETLRESIRYARQTRKITTIVWSIFSI